MYGEPQEPQNRDLLLLRRIPSKSGGKKMPALPNKLPLYLFLIKQGRKECNESGETPAVSESTPVVAKQLSLSLVLTHNEFLSALCSPIR